MKRRTDRCNYYKMDKGNTNTKVIYREALLLNLWRVTSEDELASKKKVD